MQPAIVTMSFGKVRLLMRAFSLARDDTPPVPDQQKLPTIDAETRDGLFVIAGGNIDPKPAINRHRGLRSGSHGLRQDDGLGIISRPAA